MHLCGHLGLSAQPNSGSGLHLTPLLPHFITQEVQVNPCRPLARNNSCVTKSISLVVRINQRRSLE